MLEQRRLDVVARLDAAGRDVFRDRCPKDLSDCLYRLVRQVPVPRRYPRALCLLRARPPVFEVVQVLQCPGAPLPARRRRVENVAALQIDTGDQAMHVHATVFVVMPDRRPAPAPGWVEARVHPGLEIVEYRVDLLWRRLILRRPGEDRVRIFSHPFRQVPVRQAAHVEWIAAQHPDRGPLFLLVVPLAQQVAAERPRPALPTAGELDDHCAILVHARISAIGSARSVTASTASAASPSLIQPARAAE